MRFKFVFFAICIVFVSCEKDDSEPSFNYGSITDIDGNIYRTIQIGEQTWFADNLKTQHLNNGNEITYLDAGERDILWGSLSPVCTWSNPYADSARNEGLVYNWYTVQDDNVCPTGWRVPTDDDWNELFEYAETHGSNDRKAAEKLKSDINGIWGRANNGGAAGTLMHGTNEFGFDALPGGSCYYNAQWSEWWTYTAIEHFVHWWSLDTVVNEDSEFTDVELASTFSIGYVDDNRNISKDVHTWFNEPKNKKNGYSIRCIKN